jgi:hypothetical protein
MGLTTHADDAHQSQQVNRWSVVRNARQAQAYPTDVHPPEAAWVAFAIASGFFPFEFVTRVEPSLTAGSIQRFCGLSDAHFGTVSSLSFPTCGPTQILALTALACDGMCASAARSARQAGWDHA